MNTHVEKLREALLSHQAKVVVVGLGYVGLPLATEVAYAGFEVAGIERDPDKVARLNKGDSYIADVPADSLRQVVKAGKLRAQQDFEAVERADVVVICVPTPLDKNRNPDIQYIESVVQDTLPHIQPGQLLILESTSYPGTLEETVLAPVAATGLKVGEDVFLAYSPERIDPGNHSYHLKNSPKVVGGVTATCTELACAFYQAAFGAVPHPVSSPKVAEMSKLLENVFRAVNVSLINELSQLCERMGVDIWEAIRAADTKPFGFMPFYPGPGVGGHCIPIDPVYLSWKAREYGFTPRFIELAGEVNENMPDYVVAQIMELLDSHGKAMKGSRVLVLGVAYKRDVADVRESAALRVIELLQERGAHVEYHDSYVPEVDVGTGRLYSVPLTTDALSSSDIVVITTDHSNVDYGMVSRIAPLVYDTRNAMKEFPGANVRLLGSPPNSHQLGIPAQGTSAPARSDAERVQGE